MPKPFMITFFTLSLVWANTGHALEEMFPELSPQSATSNPLNQFGLGAAELGAVAALPSADFLVWKTVEKTVAKIRAKLSKIALKMQKLELQKVQAKPSNQAEAIRISLATKEYQYEVLRAEKDVAYAKRLLTESEYASLVEEERLMAMAAGSNGIGMYVSPSYPIRDDGWRSFRVVSAEVKYAEQSETELALRKANAQLDEALLRVQGTREQIARFPISRGESALRVQLEHVQSPAFAKVAAENEAHFSKQIQHLKNRIKALDEKSLRALNLNPNLREKIISGLHIPFLAVANGVSFALFTDYLLRFYVYYKGHDPGYAPLAKVLTNEIETEAKK